MRKHRTAGQHALLRRDPDLALEGETRDGRAVAAGRRVVGDGPARRPVPGDEMTDISAFGEIDGAQEPTGIGANEMRRVGPLAHELPVVPTAADHDMRETESERPVGAGPNAQPKIRLGRETDMAWVDDDELHSALERSDGGSRVREARVGGVVAPEDQAAAVLDVRHRAAAAAGGDAARRRTRSGSRSRGPSRTCPAPRPGSACRRPSSTDA